MTGLRVHESRANTVFRDCSAPRVDWKRAARRDRFRRAARAVAPFVAALLLGAAGGFVGVLIAGSR